ncbi:MAG TPA: sugar phosphate isomerase/epimerase family protein [Gemmataceae bacterium]|jgi:sugar phosphate isomerase/epimerase
MRYVYFTKSLQSLDLAGVIAFLKDVGLDGADLAVRPGYPVHPGNVRTELPAAAKQFRDAGLAIALVTTETKLTDPDAADMVAMFEASAKAGVPFVKVGYFRYTGKYDADLAAARKRLAGFARLAERTGVRACYHTHSGAYLGNNAAGLRLLLQEIDPHHVGAFLDTGHTAVNGGPFRQEADLLRAWLTLVAIKDMAWERTAKGWAHHVVPVGQGIVVWPEVAQGLKSCGYDGVIDLHAEYETKDLAERRELAKKELAALKKTLKG